MSVPGTAADVSTSYYDSISTVPGTGTRVCFDTPNSPLPSPHSATRGCPLDIVGASRDEFASTLVPNNVKDGTPAHRALSADGKSPQTNGRHPERAKRVAGSGGGNVRHPSQPPRSFVTCGSSRWRCVAARWHDTAEPRGFQPARSPRVVSPGTHRRYLERFRRCRATHSYSDMQNALSGICRAPSSETLNIAPGSERTTALWYSRLRHMDIHRQSTAIRKE